MSWIAEIRERLERHPVRTGAPEEGLRRAGVVAPLFVRDRELWLLFTKRTETVENHRGQVSFPGGAQEPGDPDLLAAAVRETEEELGIPRAAIVHLGRLSPVVARVSNFYVEPHVAAIPYPAEITPSPGEIEAVWEFPVSALLNPTAVERRQFPGREEPVLFYHYGNRVIWGLTARILAELLEVLSGGAQ